MIEKKLYYVWVGKGKKPDIFYKCLKSWQEKLPEFTITEINEDNFNMEEHLKKNSFFRECYKRKLWAYVSDYIRVHHMYSHSGIYIDTDMEILRDLSPLLDDRKMKFFIGYEDERHISVGIFGTSERNEILKDIMDFYEDRIWSKPLWTIPKIFTYIFEEKYGLTEKRENILKSGEIKIYPRNYFYPYGYGEKFTPECISKDTYGIHWWNDSWTSLKARLFLESKHLSGIRKIIKKLRIIARYYLIEGRR